MNNGTVAAWFQKEIRNRSINERNAVIKYYDYLNMYVHERVAGIEITTNIEECMKLYDEALELFEIEDENTWWKMLELM